MKNNSIKILFILVIFISGFMKAQGQKTIYINDYYGIYGDSDTTLIGYQVFNGDTVFTKYYFDSDHYWDVCGAIRSHNAMTTPINGHATKLNNKAMTQYYKNRLFIKRTEIYEE